MSTTTTKKKAKEFQVPHILLIILFLILFACLLTYVAPAGTYQVDENGRVLAGTFEYLPNTPVSPWAALLMIQDGIINARQRHCNDAGSGRRYCHRDFHRRL